MGTMHFTKSCLAFAILSLVSVDARTQAVEVILCYRSGRSAPIVHRRNGAPIVIGNINVDEHQTVKEIKAQIQEECKVEEWKPVLTPDRQMLHLGVRDISRNEITKWKLNLPNFQTIGNIPGGTLYLTLKLQPRPVHWPSL